MRLEIPVHFRVSPERLWPELAAGRGGRLRDAELAQRAAGATNIWVQVTAAIFARAGLPVTVSDRLEPGAVNVVAGEEFGAAEADPACFCVAARADGHRPVLAHHVIEQNRRRAARRDTAYVPIWPQPGLIPRDAARGARFETVAFKGSVVNLATGMRGADFAGRLAAEGLSFRVDRRDSDPRGRRFMHDYREVDAVLAVRDLTLGDYFQKPASKLVNAWSAGVPAVLGPEPAYREERRIGLDYVEVRSAEEAVAALVRLRDDPGLRARMARNGRFRARAFTREAVLARWLEVLNGPVRARFERWQAQGAARRRLRFALARPSDRAAQRVAWIKAHRGPRMPGPPELAMRRAPLSR